MPTKTELYMAVRFPCEHITIINIANLSLYNTFISLKVYHTYLQFYYLLSTMLIQLPFRSPCHLGFNKGDVPPLLLRSLLVVDLLSVEVVLFFFRRFASGAC